MPLFLVYLLFIFFLELNVFKVTAQKIYKDSVIVSLPILVKRYVNNDVNNNDSIKFGVAVFQAKFNTKGECINVKLIKEKTTVTNSDQLRKGREAVQKQRVNADSTAPETRTAKFIVNFKKQGG